MTSRDLERRVSRLEAQIAALGTEPLGTPPGDREDASSEDSAAAQRGDGPDDATGDAEGNENVGSGGVGRRTVLKGLGLLGLGTYSLGQVRADPQGQLGTSTDPVDTIYAQQLTGGLTGGTAITSLLGDGLSIDTSSLQADLSAATSTGNGTDVYTGLSSGTLQFRSLVGGSNLNLTTGSGELTLDAEPTYPSVSDDDTTVLSAPTDINFGTNLSAADDTDDTVTVDSSAEANTASNNGGGAGVFKTKTNADLEFRSLVGGTNLNATENTDTVTLDAEPTYPSVSDDDTTVLSEPTDINFGTNLSVTDDTDDTVTVDSSGEANTASNVGTGEGLFKQKSNGDLKFRSLVGGTNVSLTGNTDDVTIDVSSSSDAWTDPDDDDLLEPVSPYKGIDLSGKTGAQVVTPWVGTSSNDALEGYVNGTRTALFGTTGLDGSSDTTAGNILLGQYAQVNNGAVGVAVGGGGSPANSDENVVNDDFGVIGGGRNNKAGTDNADNTDAAFPTIAGGEGNSANAQYTVVGGGQQNTASASYAIVPGGNGNTASGQFSFAIGQNATASHDGAYVIGDHSTSSISSDGQDEFRSQVPIYAPGINDTSARSAKQNIEPIQPASLLSSLRDLDVYEWEYKQVDDQRHIGPMAGEFREAFGIGDGETISTIDAEGIAFASIRALADVVEQKDDRIDDLATDLERKEERIEALESDLTRKDDRIDDLERDLAQKDDRIDDIETDLERKIDRIDALETRLAALEQAVSDGEC